MKEKLKVPKLRFKEFSGEWEEKNLGDICQIQTGNKDTQDKIENGKYINSGKGHNPLDVNFPPETESELRSEAKSEYKKKPPYKTDLGKIRGGK